MKYQAWKDEDGTTFSSADAIAKIKGICLDPDAVLLYEFKADSWNEAMTEHHKRMGWEPYRPMEDE